MIFTVAPKAVKLEGPTEARAEERVSISCLTDVSNPPSEIKWVVDKDNDNHKLNFTQKVIPASHGGFITSSNITFVINKGAQRVVVVCHANNNKLSENIVGTHTINVICECFLFFRIYHFYFALYSTIFSFLFSRSSTNEIGNFRLRGWYNG